jgi:hypothetical protein
MWIKPVIVILLLLLLVSLFSGFVFLMKDQGRTQRTLRSLGVRVSLAAALLAVIAWGFHTGQLRSKAPWDAALKAKEAQRSQNAAPR